MVKWERILRSQEAAPQRAICPAGVEDAVNMNMMMAPQSNESFEPIIENLSMMQSNADRSKKSQAHDMLEKFQKSVRISISDPSFSQFLTGHTFLARRMDDNTCYARLSQDNPRSATIRCNDLERQSRQRKESHQPSTED